MRRFILAALFALQSVAGFAQVVNWGDYEDSDQTIYVYFNTIGDDGVAETLTSGTLEIYEDGSTTQITSAETLTASFDSVTGLNQVAIDLSDSGFEDGKDYTVILTGGTVDSVSVAGRIVGVFSVGRYATSSTISAAVADAVWDEATSGHTTAATFGKLAADILTDTGTTLDGQLVTIDGNVDSILNDTDTLETDWIDGGRLDLILDAILVDTAEIGVAGAGLDDVAITGIGGQAVSSSSPITMNGVIATTTNITAGTMTTVTNLTNLPTIPANWLTNAGTAADFFTSIESEVDDALVAQNLDHLFTTDYDPASPPGASTALLNELIESNSGVSRFTAGALAQAPTGAGGDGSAFTAIPWNSAWDAEVQSEADDAIVANRLDHLMLNAISDPDEVEDDTVIAEMVSTSGDWTTFANANDSLEALGDGSAAILVDTGTTLDSALAVVDGNVDSILVDTGTTLDAALTVVDGNVDSILVDTGTLDTDWADGGRLDLILDTAAAGGGGGGGGTTPVLSGTAQAGATSTTFVLAAATSLADDVLNDCRINVLTGTGAGQSRTITDFVGATDTCTVAAWTVTPASGDTYEVVGAAATNLALTITENSIGIADVETAIDNKLPAGATLIAGAGATATDLDDVGSGGATVTEVTADEVSSFRTHYSGRSGYRARNIVEVNAWASGTVTLSFDFTSYLNPDTAISTVDAVTVTKISDASTVTTSNLRRQKGLRKGNYDVAAIATAGEYTVSITVTTTDSQSLTFTGKLSVK